VREERNGVKPTAQPCCIVACEAEAATSDEGDEAANRKHRICYFFDFRHFLANGFERTQIAKKPTAEGKCPDQAKHAPPHVVLLKALYVHLQIVVAELCVVGKGFYIKCLNLLLYFYIDLSKVDCLVLNVLGYFWLSSLYC
jgi:hypothetical protein